MLFDSGSNKSFVTTSVKECINPKVKRKEWLQFTTFGNSPEQSALRDVVELELCSLTGGSVTKIEAYVVPVISDIKIVHVDSVKCNYSHLQVLWFSDADQGKSDLEIIVLIGADYLWQYQGVCVIRGRPDEPVAVQTSLGWVLSGPIKGRLNDTLHGAGMVNTIRAEIQVGNVDSEIFKLWDLETIGIRPKDELSESFQDNILFNGVRYTVQLPWKVSHEALPTNYSNSFTLLFGNEPISFLCIKRTADNAKRITAQFILRARGRLNRSDLPQETEDPILLPRYHEFTEMIIFDCHRFVHHSGVSATLIELRTRFWVPKGRQLVKVLLHRCVTSRRQEGRSYDTPVTADLPEFRVRQAPPFSRVGVDFAGPLLVKGLGGEMVKSYIALFSRCISRAFRNS